MIFHPSIVTSRIESHLGDIWLAATDQGLAGLWFHDQRHLPLALAVAGESAPSPALRWPVDDGHAVLRETCAQIHAYFQSRLRQFDVPLDLTGGTPFQQSVWRELLAIPAARTSSYGALAARIGKPRAVRAVGAAVGRNPISIIVPCHRVVGAAGALTGYAGGLPRKQALLSLENAIS